MTRPDLAGVRILVVGTGLIGTSVGQAAVAAGADVLLHDSEDGRARVAASLGAGSALDQATTPPGDVDLVVVAVPPAAVAATVADALAAHPDAVITHVCSVQTQPQGEIEALTPPEDLDRFVGSHPIAGRELSGPHAAAPDLFLDRPWAICPGAATSTRAIDAVDRLARACGARPVLLDPALHDEILARVSHAPQLVASALAATLTRGDPAAAGLAGNGLRDTTRLADSDPVMWGQVASANAAAVAAALRDVAQPLLSLAAELETAAPDEAQARVRELLESGRAGRALLPGKHGRAPIDLATVHCAIPDEPGALARLLADIAADGINVEDLRVEHAPGQLRGVAELAVLPRERQPLLDSLRRRGWVATAGAGEAL